MWANSILAEAKECSEMLEGRAGKSLSKQVGKVVRTWDLTNVNSVVFSEFIDIVEADINVFAACMMGGIVSEWESSVVVTKQKSGSWLEKAQLIKKKTQPETFVARLTNSNIFSIASQACNSLLFLRRPREDGAAKREAIPHTRTSGVKAVSIRGVRKSDEIDVRIIAEYQRE